MKISLVLFLQSMSVAYRFGPKNAVSNSYNGRGRRVIVVRLGYRGIYFQLDYRGIQRNHDGASPRRQCSPLCPSYNIALSPRQSSRDNANNGWGGPAWPTRRLISSPIKEPAMFYKQLCATRRTHPLSKHSERPRRCATMMG